MQHRLPDWVDPLSLADKGRTFTTQVELAAMHRLADRLSDTAGALAVVLSFGRDDSGIRYLIGKVSGAVHLSCERCLGKFNFPIELDFSLGLLESEGMIERLPERYEPLLVEAGEVRPIEVIEDELLLALPMFPVHINDQDCQPHLPDEKVQDDVTEVTDEVRENPFAMLAKLKRND